MGVSMHPMSIKKIHLQVSVCLYSVFEPGWDLGDKPCPDNLPLWLKAGPFAGCKRTCWFKIIFTLQGSFEGDCSGVGVLSLYLPSANREVWLLCRWLRVYLWDCALKPLHPQVERCCRLVSLWLFGLRCSLVLW